MLDRTTWVAGERLGSTDNDRKVSIDKYRQYMYLDTTIANCAAVRNIEFGLLTAHCQINYFNRLVAISMASCLLTYKKGLVYTYTFVPANQWTSS